VPTPIQRKAIPAIMGGADVVAMARTGSGKTAAFVLPLLHKLQKHSFQFGARGLILSPTRELALQTFKFCKELGHFTDLRYCCLIGGDNMEDQFNQLTHNPDVCVPSPPSSILLAPPLTQRPRSIIATPGRLLHHVLEVEMSLKSIQYVVFDEADRHSS